MKIGITSTSPLKIEATKYAYRHYDNAIVQGYKVLSKINEQPVGKETLLGAKNRLQELRLKNLDLDMIVSIESGIFFEENVWIDKAAIILYDIKANKTYVTLSEGVEFPTMYVEKAKQQGFETTTVGEIMQKANYIANAQDPHKSITGLSRKHYVQEALSNLIQDVEQR